MKVSKKKNVSNKKSKDGNGRQKILDAAKKVFAQYPFSVASTRMIAKEACVEHPLIHYYFESKEKLFETVASEIYEEINQVHPTWFKDIDFTQPQKAFFQYLDNLLEYSFKNIEHKQLIYLNVGQSEINKIPGFDYILFYLDHTKKIIQENLPLHGSKQEIDMFILCFHNLLITLLGTRVFQAQLLDMDPDGLEYREWVKKALFTLFWPWVEKLLFSPRKNTNDK